ncbi:MAG: AsmA family protein, partial [Candidatus Binatia bacterium]
IQEAEKALGRDISVGKVKVNVWPGIGFRLENFALAEDPRFAAGDFVRAKDLQVNVKVLPLLRKNVQVKKLILNEPVISVIRNKDGVYNFSSIGKRDKDKTQDALKEKERAAKEPTDKSAFLVALLDVTRGSLRYRDVRDGTDLQIQKLDLAVKDFDPQKPFDVKLAAALFAAKQNVTIDTRMGPFSSDSDFRKALLDGVIGIDSLDLNQLKSALPQIRNALPKDLTLGGLITVKDLKLKGMLGNLAFKGSIDGTKTRIDYGKSLHKPAGISFELALDGQYTRDKLVLRQTTGKLHTMKLQSKGEIGLGDRPALNLSIDSEPTSLDGWGQFIPALKDYDPKGAATLHATIRRAPGAAAPPEIVGTLNLSDVSFKPPRFSKPISN